MAINSSSRGALLLSLARTRPYSTPQVYDGALLLRSTSASGARLEKVPAHPNNDAADVTFTMWPDDERQSIIGFGGAITQASTVVWKKLPPHKRQKVVDLFFGDGGIGASIARIPINSCDFAEENYSEDDVADDFELKHFDDTLAHDEEQLLPLVRAALATNSNLQLLASPWSPPAWMKSNNQMNGNGFPRGLKPEAAASWAMYLSRWLGAFAKAGAMISWLTVQNEPLAPSPWEACYYDSSLQVDFIGDHLGPALAAGAATGRHPPVTLLAFDDQKNNIVEWADAMLTPSSKASQYTGGLAYHWYAGDHFDQLAKAKADHSDKIFLGTEATYELTRLNSDMSDAEWMKHGVWERGEGYGHAILNDLNAGSSGWIDWNIILDSTGGPNHLGNTCDAPMVTSESFDEVYLHPQYWYLGHFAKFVPPGSKVVRIDRVAANGDPNGYGNADGVGVYNFSAAVAYGMCPPGPPRATALKTPDGLVVVVLNCGDAEAVVRIVNGASGGGSAAGYPGACDSDVQVLVQVLVAPKFN